MNRSLRREERKGEEGWERKEVWEGERKREREGRSNQQEEAKKESSLIMYES